MTEGLFLITTLFVAYVVYVIINEKKSENVADKSAPAASQTKPKAVAIKSPKAPAPVAAKPEPVKSAVTKSAASKPAPKPAAKLEPVKEAVKTAPAKASKAAKSAPVKAPEPVAEQEPGKAKGLKDPKSGEVVSSYTNYRFMKRWIKEALVAEGLLEKVYKNDELNADLDGKIKSAISKLEGMKKYQP